MWQKSSILFMHLFCCMYFWLFVCLLQVMGSFTEESGECYFLNSISMWDTSVLLSNSQVGRDSKVHNHYSLVHTGHSTQTTAMASPPDMLFQQTHSLYSCDMLWLQTSSLMCSENRVGCMLRLWHDRGAVCQRRHVPISKGTSLALKVKEIKKLEFI